MKQETEKIYNTAFDLIELRLGKKEQVHPFSVLLKQNEKKPDVGMYEPTGEDTSKHIKLIRSELRKKTENEEIIALCLCYDMTVTDPRTNEKIDAVLIELADKETGTTNIYIPYNFSDEVIIKKPFQTVSDQNYF